MSLSGIPLSAQHLDAPPHQNFYTLDEIQKASPTGEVFINGQYDGPQTPTVPLVNGVPLNGVASLLSVPTMSPKPIARSFVSVTPVPHTRRPIGTGTKGSTWAPISAP